MKRILFFTLILFLQISCGGGAGNSLVADFTPTDTFIVDLDNPGTDVSITHTAPYFGSLSSCPHNGAHIHFVNTSDNAFGYVNVLAPMNGTVNEIQTCKSVGESDAFQIDLRSDEFADITFEMSIEPQNGFYCTTAEGGDADFYKNLILVSEGDTVTAGQIIAKMPIPNTGSDGGHIHFNLRQLENACPNIFSAATTEKFAEFFDSFPCDEPQISTLCYAPDEGEDITGLFTENFE